MVRRTARIGIALVGAGLLAACGSGPAITNQQVPVPTPKSTSAGAHALVGRFPIRCVGDANVNALPPRPAPAGAFIEFGPGSKVHGNDGANDWAGTVKQTGSTFRISNLSTTLVGSTFPAHNGFDSLESGKPTKVTWSHGVPTFVVGPWLMTAEKRC